MGVPVGEQMLSRHMLLLGGIGTGKSNAFNFLIRNVRSGLTDRDVVIIFDTKGDFYRDFYRPGDVVISNDSRASGGSGPDYWNLFGEVSIDDRVEENILEIAKGFFSEKLAQTTQPFFPNAAKDLFAALLLHMTRTEQFRDFRNNQALRSTFDTFSVASMKKILQSHPDLKAMTSYIQDENSGQTLGPVVYGIALMFGYQRGILVIGGALLSLLILFLIVNLGGQKAPSHTKEETSHAVL